MNNDYISRKAALDELIEEWEFESPMYSEEENKFVGRGLKIAIKDIERLPAADISPELEKFAEVVYYRLLDNWSLLKGSYLYCSPSNPRGDCDWLHNEILRCLEEFKEGREESTGEKKVNTFYHFRFADGYECVAKGFSSQELRVEEDKHGKLLSKKKEAT